MIEHMHRQRLSFITPRTNIRLNGTDCKAGSDDQQRMTIRMMLTEADNCLLQAGQLASGVLAQQPPTGSPSLERASCAASGMPSLWLAAVLLNADKGTAPLEQDATDYGFFHVKPVKSGLFSVCSCFAPVRRRCSMSMTLALLTCLCCSRLCLAKSNTLRFDSLCLEAARIILRYSANTSFCSPE